MTPDDYTVRIFQRHSTTGRWEYTLIARRPTGGESIMRPTALRDWETKEDAERAAIEHMRADMDSYSRHAGEIEILSGADLIARWS